MTSNTQFKDGYPGLFDLRKYAEERTEVRTRKLTCSCCETGIIILQTAQTSCCRYEYILPSCLEKLDKDEQELQIKMAKDLEEDEKVAR